LAVLFCSHFPLCGAVLFVSNYITNTIDRVDEGGRRSVFASGLNQPRGLVFDDSGLLYAANSSSNQILRFAPDGTESIFATELLNGPRGLAFDDAGTLFVTNGIGNTVVTISPLGDVSLFAGGSFLSSPRGLAFDAQGNLFVANSGNNTILKLAIDGTRTVLTSTLLSTPYGLVFDSAGTLYVSNLSGSVVKWNADGTFTSFISTQLASPYGMVFDEAGTLFAANLGSGLIQEFSAAGRFLGTYSSAPNTGPTFLVSGPAAPEPGTALACLAGAALLVSLRRAGGQRSGTGRLEFLISRAE